MERNKILEFMIKTVTEAIKTEMLGNTPNLKRVAALGFELVRLEEELDILKIGEWRRWDQQFMIVKTKK